MGLVFTQDIASLSALVRSPALIQAAACKGVEPGGADILLLPAATRTRKAVVVATYVLIQSAGAAVDWHPGDRCGCKG
ncbi:hypothetical protein ALP71_03675 [Pseudomonas coronafaciens pv. garcae]|nr:hypothetical protein ALP71_03675 [Pseudomonas coronafaciens pv. garcae]